MSVDVNMDSGTCDDAHAGEGDSGSEGSRRYFDVSPYSKPLTSEAEKTGVSATSN